MLFSITQTGPKTVFSALRLAPYSLIAGDSVRLFLSGCGVGKDQSIVFRAIPGSQPPCG